MPDAPEAAPTIAEQVQAAIDGPPATPAETPQVAESTETPAETPAPESTPEAAVEVKEPEKAPETPIDPALVDAARQSGWSEEDITDHVKEVGAERASKTLRSMHDRLMRDVDALAAPLAPTYSQPAPVQFVPDARRQALEAKLADAEPELAAEIKAILTQQDQGIAQGRAYQAQQQAESAARIVNTVIDRDFAAKGYDDVYGKPGARMTRMQASMRREVFETADALAGRYRQLGRPISDEDAIVRAHLSVNRERVLATAETAKKAATGEIRKSLETRQKARSIPPTSSVTPEDGGDWKKKAIGAIDSVRKH